jgi:peroxin-12
MAPSPYRPHFFELYAAERLTSALRPALRYTLEVLSVRNPSLLPYAARADDIFTAVSLVLEASQLSASSSTLSESFYGLRRAPAFTPAAALPLSRAQVVAALLSTVLLPHAKIKLDAAYSARTGGALAQLAPPHGRLPWRSADAAAVVAGSRRRSHRPRRLRTVADLAAAIRALAVRLHVEELFVRWYPWFNAAYEGAALLFNVLYLLGYTRYFSPTLLLHGLVVRRLTARELAESELGGAAARGAPRGGALATAAGWALSGAKHLFVTSVFAFRFLEYYYAAESRVPPEGAVAPSPPAPLPPARGIDPAVAASTVDCPLCQRPRVNAAACTASGYVFCYTCIYAHLDMHRKCPVTLMPATTDNILRVYEQAE